MDDPLETLLMDNDSQEVLALTSAILTTDSDWGVHTPIVIALWREAGRCLDSNIANYSRQVAFWQKSPLITLLNRKFTFFQEKRQMATFHVHVIINHQNK
jgi:hypothetical protein